MICRICKENKSAKDFNKDRRTKSGLRNYCKICHLNMARKQRGIVIPQDFKIADACEACGITLDLCIDHNHMTGKVRGTLCRLCNSVEGSIANGRVQKILDYLGRKNGS